MRKHHKRSFYTGIIFLIAFMLWTAAVRLVDVQAIGPEGSTVGFAKLNGFVHTLTGVHMLLYTITDWLSLLPLLIVLIFAAVGLAQLLARRSIRKVDPDILALGGFYLAVAAAFLFFELFVVNFRPVLIAGVLEASYPSSTTMLVLCVMPTCMMQCQRRIKGTQLRRYVTAAATAYCVFMVAARFLSGVHWCSDIIGGVLLSSGLAALYRAVIIWIGEKNHG